MKKLKAKIGEFQKDGETKGRYIDVGVILSNQNGEYAILNPVVSLSGVLMKQRLMAKKSGGKVGDGVMCSIWDDQVQQQPQQPQQPQQQAPQQQAPQQQAPQQQAPQQQQGPANPDDYF